MKNIYKYFCGICGASFSSNVPERDGTGHLTGLCCPECGCYDLYPSNKKGSIDAVKSLSRYESSIDSYISAER